MTKIAQTYRLGFTRLLDRMENNDVLIVTNMIVSDVMQWTSERQFNCWQVLKFGFTVWRQAVWTSPALPGKGPCR